MEHETLKKVLAFGTFDIFHKGHENFLNQAKKFGDYLTVIIARDSTVQKVKGKLPKNNELERLKAVVSSHIADKVILGDLKDKYKIINRYRPDVICLGYDQVAFTKNLDKKLHEFNLDETKIIRLKSFKPEKYKSSKI